MLTHSIPATESPRPAATAGGFNASAVPRRLDWVDACKGMCIILVVYGHISGGLETSGAVAYGSAYDRLRSWVYLFHMPAFFFLSGFLASRAMGRSLREVFVGKLRTIAYPYVIWTAIYLAVQEALARFANNPPDPGAALQFLWKPYGYGLWFLYSLFLISLLFHLLTTTRLQREIILALAVILHVASVYSLFNFWPILNQAMLNFVYFAVGGLYAGPLLELLSAGRAVSWISCSFIALAVMTALASFPDLLPAFLGIAGAVFLARGVVGSLPGAFFSWLGFYSLEIYLGHPLFGTASRALLTLGPIHGAIPLIVCGVTAGVFGSVALAISCRKLNFPYLYRWPTAQPQMKLRPSA